MVSLFALRVCYLSVSVSFTRAFLSLFFVHIPVSLLVVFFRCAVTVKTVLDFFDETKREKNEDKSTE